MSNKYNKLISKMKKRGVKFSKGLTQIELEMAEDAFLVEFPLELKEFLARGLPVSNGFYNWRDLRTANVKYIEKVMQIPTENLLAEVHEGEYWCASWGEKPLTIDQSRQKVTQMLSKAPQLIPIYGHRYIPGIVTGGNVPILSIVGSDVIYYGGNLIEYFENEFQIDKEFSVASPEAVDFWHEIIVNG